MKRWALLGFLTSVIITEGRKLKIAEVDSADDSTITGAIRGSVGQRAAERSALSLRKKRDVNFSGERLLTHGIRDAIVDYNVVAESAGAGGFVTHPPSLPRQSKKFLPKAAAELHNLPYHNPTNVEQYRNEIGYFPHDARATYDFGKEFPTYGAPISQGMYGTQPGPYWHAAPHSAMNIRGGWLSGGVNLNGWPELQPRTYYPNTYVSALPGIRRGLTAPLFRPEPMQYGFHPVYRPPHIPWQISRNADVGASRIPILHQPFAFEQQTQLPKLKNLLGKVLNLRGGGEASNRNIRNVTWSVTQVGLGLWRMNVQFKLSLARNGREVDCLAKITTKENGPNIYLIPNKSSVRCREEGFSSQKLPSQVTAGRNFSAERKNKYSGR